MNGDVVEAAKGSVDVEVTHGSFVRCWIRRRRQPIIKQFTVIRHGESQTNATNTFEAGNQYDLDPLTRLVRRMLAASRNALQPLPVNLIISSGYLRAQHRGRDRPGDRGPIVPVWEGFLMGGSAGRRP